MEVDMNWRIAIQFFIVLTFAVLHGQNIFAGEPNPLLVGPNVILFEYDTTTGRAIGGYLSKQIFNQGADGNVFVSATVSKGLLGDSTHTTVLFMDSTELIEVHAYFYWIMASSSFEYSWSTRTMQPGDTSFGRFEVLRDDLVAILKDDKQKKLGYTPVKQLYQNRNGALLVAFRKQTLQNMPTASFNFLGRKIQTQGIHPSSGTYIIRESDKRSKKAR
jgi:hypothetical protein